MAVAAVDSHVGRAGLAGGRKRLDFTVDGAFSIEERCMLQALSGNAAMSF
jgi:hypothetical protein